MKVLAVTSEFFPFAKTGGLADVTGALPKALSNLGVSTTTLIPGYTTVLERLAGLLVPVAEMTLLSEPVMLRRARTGAGEILVLDAPSLFHRAGGPYNDVNGQDFGDNWKRFAVLSLAGAEIARGALPGGRPDVVHVHDWQAALTPVYMRHRGCSVPTVLTIHNLAFQGQFDASLLPFLDLPASHYRTDLMEYYGGISYLKGGLVHADAITTVSPTYAREILTARFGMGMEGVLRTRRNDLLGIVNGVDEEVWDPTTDPYLPYNYGATNPRQKEKNKKILLQRLGLDTDPGPLFGVVSRLTWQKGMDLLAAAADDFLSKGGKLVICGRGDRAIEQQLEALAHAHPGRMSVYVGYEEHLAHLIHGSADAIIQPSRFEPCGLTQLYALRYGSVPIVSRTGGLSETVIDANVAALSARVATGFQFHPVTVDALRHALSRALHAYHDGNHWARLRGQAMKARFSWDRSAREYASLYGRLSGVTIGQSTEVGFTEPSAGRRSVRRMVR